MTQVCVPMGEELGAYGFPHGHPFGPNGMGGGGYSFGNLAATWTAVVRQLLTTSSAEASEG